jgi:hypothetical protein
MLLHSNCHKIIATSPEQWQRDGEEIAHSAIGEVERIGAVVNAGVAWTGIDDEGVVAAAAATLYHVKTASGTCVGWSRRPAAVAT